MDDPKTLFTKARAQLVLKHPFFATLALRLTPVEQAGDPEKSTFWTDGSIIGYNPEYIKTLSNKEIQGVICHEVMHCALSHMTRRKNRDIKKWGYACDFAINPIIIDAELTLPKGGLYDKELAGKSAEEIYTLLPELPPMPSDFVSCGEFDSSVEKKTKSEIIAQEEGWKVALAQATQQAKMMGKLPAGIERLVDDFLDPKIDWREQLKRFVDSTARNDYSWARPNRRYIHKNIYLPSLHSQQLGHVVSTVDTSGSINQRELEEFSGELRFILEEYGAECTVIYCDSQVAKVEHFNPGDYFRMEAKGGGGTDFIPPFEYVDENGISPVAFLYFTDGFCNSFPKEPPYPVLWIKSTDGYSRHSNFKPPFGEVLELR